MSSRITNRGAAGALVGLPTVGAIGLMLLNDHVLKGWFPAWFTGKASDFAFLFFAPIVLVFVARARTRSAIVSCHLAPAGLFVAINLSQRASETLADAMSLVVPTQLWPDPWDLIALISLPLAYAYLVRPRSRTHVRRSMQMSLTATAAFACMATSPRREPYVPTHEPVYMSWEALRSAGQVLPPRPVETRGKLLIVDEHLFLSDPGLGVHVFDNRDPRAPDPLMFIAIPGNRDIAVLGDRLYADCYVDLLTFELDLEAGQARLIGQLTNQFHPDLREWLSEEDQTLLHYVYTDPDKGIVIGFKPITPAAEGATP